MKILQAAEKMKIDIRKIIFISIPLVLLISIFSHILPAYFSQDDFFHLRVVMNKQYQDIPSLFASLQKDYAFYRPLSRETFNLLMYKSFGLNPLPFHIVNLTLIAMNMGILFIITKKLTKRLITSFLAVLLYSVNSIHSIELYYLASVQTLTATLFTLLGILFYLSSSKIKYYFASVFCFILGLLTHETAIVLLGILIVWEFIKCNRVIWNKQLVKRLLPFILIGALYLSNTSLFNRLPQQEIYQPVLSIKSIINSLGWYSLWVMGVPEFVVDFIGPKFALNHNLIKWYGDYFKIFLPLFLFIVVSFLFIIFRYRNKLFKAKVGWFIMMAYLISLSPFLLFPQHKSSYYLTLASIWFSILMAIPLAVAWEGRRFMKILVVLLIFSFSYISYQTINLNKVTYWAAKRSEAARFLLVDIKKTYPNLPQAAIFYFKNDPGYPDIAFEWGSSAKQAFYILSGSDAIKLLFQDPTIQVYYEDMVALPTMVDKNKVINYTAKFPY